MCDHNLKSITFPLCLDMYIDDMNFIYGLPKANFGSMSQKEAKIVNIAENMKYHKFLRL